jgi:hypothetical protein
MSDANYRRSSSNGSRTQPETVESLGGGPANGSEREPRFPGPERSGEGFAAGAASDGRRETDERTPWDSGFISMPEIRRLSMIPSKIECNPLRRLWRAIFVTGNPAKESAARAGVSASEAGAFPAGWRVTAKGRRLLLALLVIAQTAIASWSLSRIFPGSELSGLELAILANFAVLFSWISFSFWTNVAGFLALWRNCKVYALGDNPDFSDRGGDAHLQRRCQALLCRYRSDIPLP